MAISAKANRYAAKVVEHLSRAYPEAKCALDFRSPLELLVATILSAQCTDVRVNLVTKDLFAKYRTAADYAQAPLEKLEEAVQSTGFYHNKAKSIQVACRTLLEKYGGQVPQDMDALVQLPGIGRKTANVVLGTAFSIPSGIAVDTHVARVSRRLGLTSQKDPVKIERDLMEQIPKQEWIDFSHRMVHHGRRICAARKPKCHACPLNAICPKIGIDAQEDGGKRGQGEEGPARTERLMSPL
jgi:endonuclease-3